MSFENGNRTTTSYLKSHGTSPSTDKHSDKIKENAAKDGMR